MSSIRLILPVILVLFIQESLCCEDTHLEETQKNIEQLFGMCVDLSYTSCKSSKSSLRMEELKSTSRRLQENPLLRNRKDYGGGNCFERASVISKIIDEEGYRSEKILFQGDILVPHRSSKGVDAIYFEVHIANVVTLEDPPKAPAKFVIDPMYLDEPMPLKEYIDLISVSDSKRPTTHKMVSQTYEIDSRSTSFAPLPESISSCQYSSVLLEKNLQVLSGVLSLPDEEQRTSFDSWERAKLAYRFFYGIDFARAPTLSKLQIEDAKSTVNHLPKKIKKERLADIEKMLKGS